MQRTTASDGFTLITGPGQRPMRRSQVEHLQEVKTRSKRPAQPVRRKR